MAANGSHATRASGPRCIALVGPFQSGKTTLLEAILARTGAIPRQGTVEAGNTVGDSQPGSAPSSHERRAHRRHHRLHGRQLHVSRLPRIGRIRPRHARGAAGDRCRGGGVRNGREEDSAASAHSARAGGPENSAHPVPQQDRQGQCRRSRRAQAVAAGLAHEADHAANPDLLRRSLSPALSISRSNAPLSTRSTPRPKSFRSRAISPIAKRPRASRCWKRWPTTTTN